MQRRLAPLNRELFMPRSSPKTPSRCPVRRSEKARSNGGRNPAGLSHRCLPKTKGRAGLPSRPSKPVRRPAASSSNHPGRPSAISLRRLRSARAAWKRMKRRRFEPRRRPQRRARPRCIASPSRNCRASRPASSHRTGPDQPLRVSLNAAAKPRNGPNSTKRPRSVLAGPRRLQARTRRASARGMPHCPRATANRKSLL